MGVVLLEQGKASQALAYLDKALEIDPEHGQALLNSAILLQEFGRPELRSIARERLLKLLVMDGECNMQLFYQFLYCAHKVFHSLSQIETSKEEMQSERARESGNASEIKTKHTMKNIT